MLGGLQQMFELRQIGVRVAVVHQVVQIFRRFPDRHLPAVELVEIRLLRADEIIGLISMIQAIEFAHTRAGVGGVIAELLLLLFRVSRLKRGLAGLGIARLQIVFPFIEAAERLRVWSGHRCRVEGPPNAVNDAAAAASGPLSRTENRTAERRLTQSRHDPDTIPTPFRTKLKNYFSHSPAATYAQLNRELFYNNAIKISSPTTPAKVKSPRMIRFGWIGLSTAFICASVPSRGDDWPQWRGPQRNGVSRESAWNFQWPDDGPKTAWKANVGRGYSGMVIADGRMFTAGHADGKDTLFCFDAGTGKQIWKHSYNTELGDKYFDGGPTGTPTIDGDKVYWLSRWGDLFWFEAASGKSAWEKNVQKDTSMKIPDWGFAGAPYVHKEILVLNIGDAGMGVEKSTGTIAWKSDNENPGYSTPLPVPGAAEPLVVFG